MIVHTPKPKRRTKAVVPRASPPIATVVTARKPGPRCRPPKTIDPNVEAPVKAWFAKNIRPPGT